MLNFAGGEGSEGVKLLADGVVLSGHWSGASGFEVFDGWDLGRGLKVRIRCSVGLA